MRAVAVRAFRGAAELMDLPPPLPAEGEVEVRVTAAGVNPFDWKVADGALEGRRPHVFPLVLGVDGAGVVESVGPNVTRFAVGDRIAGQFLHDPVGIGTYAERSTTPESNGVARVPVGVSEREAAALPTAGMTALYSVRSLGLAKGETMLLVGASGGVGSFATQIASADGVRVVAVARASSRQYLTSLGAHDVIDRGEEPVADRVRSAYPQPFDGLLDLASDTPGFAAIAGLVRAGRTVASTIGAAPREGTLPHGVRTLNVDLRPNAELLGELLDRVATRRLKVPVEATLPLEDGPRVIGESRAGRLRGKTVLVP